MSQRTPGPPVLDVEWSDVTLADILCVGPIVALTLYRLFGSSITALWIGTHPVRLNLIRASYASLIAMGAFVHSGRVLWWVAMLIPIPYLMADDPFVYWAGRRYGSRLTDFLIASNPGTERAIRRVEKIMLRYGVFTIIIANLPFIPIPVSIVYFIAGDSGMRLWVFLLADSLSVVILVAMLLALGFWLGDTAQNVAKTISAYGLWISVALIAVTLLWTARNVRKGMRDMYPHDDRTK